MPSEKNFTEKNLILGRPQCRKKKEFNFRQTAMSKKRPRICLEFCSKEKEFLFEENSNFFRTKSDFPSDKILARPKYTR